MVVEIAWKQNILVTDFHLLKSLLVVLGFGSQAFVCGFSRQNINSVHTTYIMFFNLFNVHYSRHKLERPLEPISIYSAQSLFQPGFPR